MDAEPAETADAATPDAGGSDPAERSLVDDLRLLARDARTLAEAEVAFQKSRAGVLGGGIARIAALGAAAVFLLCLALIGLVVGLIFALIPLLTAWGATAVVVGALLLLTLSAALWARASWRRLAALVSDEGPDR